MVVFCTFRVLRTNTYAFAAVYTALTCYYRLTVSNTYRLGRAALYAVGAADTFALVKRYGMEKLPHFYASSANSVMPYQSFGL